MAARDTAALSELESGLAHVVESLKKLKTAEEWVNQHDSPIGKRKHLEAVRSGELVGSKCGNLVLVRRDDIDAYIERHRVKVPSAVEAEEERAYIDRLVKGKPRERKQRNSA